MPLYLIINLVFLRPGSEEQSKAALRHILKYGHCPQPLRRGCMQERICPQMLLQTFIATFPANHL